MTISTSTDIFKRGLYDRMVAKHYGYHSIAPADLNK